MSGFNLWMHAKCTDLIQALLKEYGSPGEYNSSNEKDMQLYGAWFDLEDSTDVSSLLKTHGLNFSIQIDPSHDRSEGGAHIERYYGVDGHKNNTVYDFSEAHDDVLSIVKLQYIPSEFTDKYYPPFKPEDIELNDAQLASLAVLALGDYVDI